MEVSTHKVRTAIHALRSAAEQLLYERGNAGVTAAECIKSIAALEASLAIAGEPKVICVVGETD
jgi:hypothetical protein